MIHSFSCKNFYSIKGETTINFAVDNNAPQNDGYLTTPAGERLSLVEAVIGPNASGKTNLLRVLPFFKWLVVDSFQESPDSGLMFRGFGDGYGDNEPSEVSATFEIDKKIYTYEFTMNSNMILSEILKVKTYTHKRLTSKRLFTRIWDENAKNYSLVTRNFALPSGIKSAIRTNASLTSTAHRLNHRQSTEIVDYWEAISTNVAEAGWIGHFENRDFVPIRQAILFYDSNEKYRELAEKILTRFDIGFEAFDFTEDHNQKLYNIKHKFNNRSISLPYRYESSGTKQLFILLASLLISLEEGGIAVIDEFDANLHPDTITELVGMFTDPATNPKRAQLLFSTHSHQILSQLDKYQIVLTEKNEEGATEAWRLDEMSGIRTDDNYYNKYMAGAYGAVPRFE